MISKTSAKPRVVESSEETSREGEAPSEPLRDLATSPAPIDVHSPCHACDSEQACGAPRESGDKKVESRKNVDLKPAQTKMSVPRDSSPSGQLRTTNYELRSFHPIIQAWFTSRFAAPTEPQIQSWPLIAARESVLVAAPTGSGKTLTAFLALIDRLLRAQLEGTLESHLHIVYISPLRALSNDMHKNLVRPLEEITQTAKDLGYNLKPITIGLRTGDTSSHERAKLTKKPPHILVTTPESLFLMLTSEQSRKNMRHVETVIVDEIHALTKDKRGSHLALTLERLEHLTDTPLQRIGLSATQKPLERVASFLMGNSTHRRPKVTHSKARPQRSLFDSPCHACGSEHACNCAEESQTSLDTRMLTQSCEHGTQSKNTQTGMSVPLDSPSAQRLTPSACHIINIGHQRTLDLQIFTPKSELSAVCSNDQWAECYEQIVELVNSHRSTLIFVNTRRMAERISHQLTVMLGEDAVSSHHGSLSYEIRHSAEQRLKAGQLKAVVATSSLEMGIDIGYIDLVIQIGSPRAIASFLQRIGRSGHALGLVPKGRLLALTRDELIEAMALIRAVRTGKLDSIQIRNKPLDVLQQQIVAEVSTSEWNTDELFNLCRSADPYKDLTREEFDNIIMILSEGLTEDAGRSQTFLHHDHVNKKLRARKAARLIAINNAGAIPEIGSYRVVVDEGDGKVVVGSVDEDFAVESMAGDIFLLGNTSWRIQGLRGNDLVVADAKGQPPSIPFWRGEAPGRTLELSEEVSSLREDLEQRIIEVMASSPRPFSPGEKVAESSRSDEGSLRNCKNEPITHLPCHACGSEQACNCAQENQSSLDLQPRAHMLTQSSDHGTKSSPPAPSAQRLAPSPPSPKPQALSPPTFESLADDLSLECGATPDLSLQAIHYIAAQHASLGVVPSQKRIVFERFFDESGGMQIVVHAPFGGRITRGWGLAMRKRFCRSFDFELQATADDDGFILTLGPQHSFPLESLFPMLTPANVYNMLEQAVIYVPTFQVRWRWIVANSLLVERRRNGKKVPPSLQRFRADDLLTAVFPKLTGCQEEHTGDHEIPDHPLVKQTMQDCMEEAFDLPGIIEVLRKIESGEITMIARDTREPSPFSYELLNANPYAFLDGGEIQDRRARAVQQRRTFDPDSMTDLTTLDPLAIQTVITEAQPKIRNEDELHDLLLGRIAVPLEELTPWKPFVTSLINSGRATFATLRSFSPGEKVAESNREVRKSISSRSDEGTLRNCEDNQISHSPCHACGSEQACDCAQENQRSPETQPRDHMLVQSYKHGTQLRAKDTQTGMSVPRVSLPSGQLPITNYQLLIPAERLPAFLAIYPAATIDPPLSIPPTVKQDWDPLAAKLAMIRGLMELAGPLTANEVALRCHLRPEQAFACLEALEGEGVVIRGRFRNPLPREGETPSEPLRGIATSPAQFDSHSPCHACGSEQACSCAQENQTPLDPQPRAHMLTQSREHGTTSPLAPNAQRLAPSPPSPTPDWCHRRLLARIHRLTVDGLRQQIEPVGVPTFIRYLTRHQGLLPGYHKQNANGLFETIAQLQGIDIQAAAWEPEVLTSRVEGYKREWLDELCFTGEVSWARLFPPNHTERKARPMVAISKFAPISLFLREDLSWLCTAAPERDTDDLTSPAQQAVEILTEKGASFATDLQSTMQLLPSQMTDCLGELVSRGIVTSDGFSGLRGLIGQLTSDDNKKLPKVVRQRQRHISGSTGRWSLLTLDCNEGWAPTTLEQWAWQLLRRWGVIFKDLLQREQGAPPWWQLVSTYRRMEARGEIRGGRFIKGVAGEQFALPDAVTRLREIRDEMSPTPELITLSAADPLNLVGILDDHPRLPATTNNKLAYLDGTLAASLIASEFQLHKQVDKETEHFLRLTLGSTASNQCNTASPQVMEVLKQKASVPRMVSW
jgi:Lhr-like helicase